MGIKELLEELRKEWSVLKQAPLLFTSALILISIAITAVIYQVFKFNLDHKDQTIKTLKDQLAATVPASQAVALAAPVLPTAFRINLQGGNVFIPDEAPDLTGILLDAIITNTGKPSVVLEWALSVVPQTGKPIRAQVTKIPQSVVARGPFNSAHVSSSESLTESTLKEPLMPDVPRTGKLLFYVRLPKSTVLTSVLELSATDVTGKEYGTRQDIREWLAR